MKTQAKAVAVIFLSIRCNGLNYPNFSRKDHNCKWRNTLTGYGRHFRTLLLTSIWSPERNRFPKLGFQTGLVSCLSTMSMLSTSNCDGDGTEKTDKFAATSFYPPINAYEVGSIQVSDIHTISYSIYGNPTGKPVLFIHGGPGGGTEPNMARYFDPTVYRVILVDQRGCGKSIPFANLIDNTTYDTIRDFEKLREKLGIDKWMLFGGSWGSCLCLAYAMEHPSQVTALVLRGIFLLRKKELDWLYQGPGASFLFPEDWQAYIASIPEEERGDFMSAYGKRLRGEHGEEEMYSSARAWSVWEGRVSKLHQDTSAADARFGDQQFSLAFARIENHYFTNKGWFPRDGYLLEKAQIDRIRHIPTVIVQGRYDVVCPAVSAFELKQAMPEAELVMTMAGHSGYEPDTIRELVSACDRFRTL